MASLPPNPRRALAVVAHPDDVEFMAGGLISRWAREGVELHYCLLTDGNSGSRDPSITPEAIARPRSIRQAAPRSIVEPPAPFPPRRAHRRKGEGHEPASGRRGIARPRGHGILRGPLFTRGPRSV